MPLMGIDCKSSPTPDKASRNLGKTKIGIQQGMLVI